MALKEVLTIADSDMSAGAGIQTDLRTSQELNTYGIVTLTAVIAVDKETWSRDVALLPMDVFEKQLETVTSIGPDAVRTSMLGTEEIIKRVGEAFKQSGAEYFVADPVMVREEEDKAFNPGNIDTTIKCLLPKTTVVTPNLSEANQLSGLGKLTSTEDMKRVAKIIYDQGAQRIVIKGSKTSDQDKSCDLYYDDQTYHQLVASIFQQSYNHDVGCMFTVATTAYLADGKSPKEAIISAKAFAASAIKNGWKMNNLVDPVDHDAYSRIEHIDANVKEVQRSTAFLEKMLVLLM